MDGGAWSSPKSAKPKKAQRIAKEEFLNREGRWVREFSARVEAWPVLEGWVQQYEYHLIAMKGGRRLYVKGDKFYQRYIDIKQSERGVTVVAWVHVSFLMRALYLFQIPGELMPEPQGFQGVRVRRVLCRELNDLLDRFRQSAIYDSDRFHLSDVDPTIWLTMGSMIATTLAFLLPTIRKLEIKAGLSQPLLTAIGQQAGFLAGIGAILMAFHWVATKKLSNQNWKIGSAGFFTAIFFTVCVWIFTQTTAVMNQAKFAHHCVEKFDDVACRALVSKWSSKDRKKLREYLKALDHELVVIESLKPQ